MWLLGGTASNASAQSREQVIFFATFAWENSSIFFTHVPESL